MFNKHKKSHRFLSLSDKLKIIEALNAGQTATSLSKQYRISRAAISNLKRKKGNLKDVNQVNNLNEMALNKRKVIKKVHNENLEKAIVMWYNEKRLMGQPVSGPTICEKALIFNNRLNGSEKFKATTGWLTAFKRRYGVKIIQEDKLSIDGDAAREFCLKFQQLIHDQNYDNMNLVFNADECGILWKNLPKATNDKDENSAGWKENKEKVSVLFCANADGSHALPLLIIGKSWSSRSILSTTENIQQLPVMYQNESSSSMTSEIFLDWYTNIFIPSVEEMQEKTKNYGKVLLLIDTAKCHPSMDVLNSVNENFQVMYIPSKITFLVQPMGQGIIEKTKRTYRKAFITCLLNASNDDNMTVDEFIEQHTMEDCCFMLSNAFEAVTTLHLKSAWNKLYGTSQLDEVIDNDDETLEIKVFYHMLQKISGFERVYPVTIKTWLNVDQYDLGWESLIDDEIIEFVTNQANEIVHETNSNEQNEILISNKKRKSTKETKKKKENFELKLNELNKTVEIKEECENRTNNISKSVEVTIRLLHEWCKKRKEYSETDCQLLHKWELLAKEASEKKN
ncbi:jerky protein homolog-like [Leptopilina heterotoma]|uniref:jerky protein homolog-like n=1 Tax=Leptopilina heterotoma TaxID=63436 RepID=UPI001CA8BAEC|nr:jerky protein homolog-like [Leptopilina heterotoma]